MADKLKDESRENLIEFLHYKLGKLEPKEVRVSPAFSSIVFSEKDGWKSEVITTIIQKSDDEAILSFKTSKETPLYNYTLISSKKTKFYFANKKLEYFFGDTKWIVE